MMKWAVACALLGLAAAQLVDTPYCRNKFYRYFNGHDHFYTTNAAEIGTTTPGHVGHHGYRSEGFAGYLASSALFGAVPLFRYYNGFDHFYTTNIDEIGTSTPGHRGKHGYTSEGIAGYCRQAPTDSTKPLYRYWNGRDHFYTTNWNEIGRGAHGWHLEGIACYVFVPGGNADRFDITDYGVQAAGAGALAVLALAGWQAYRKRRGDDEYETPGDGEEADPLL